MSEPTWSIVIATYLREQVLIATREAMRRLDPGADEILVVDQSPTHETTVATALDTFAREGCIRLLRPPTPNIPAAMNLGLRQARGDFVLFVDDDVRPSPNLLAAHCSAQAASAAGLVAGKVVQPWSRSSEAPTGDGLDPENRDLDVSERAVTEKSRHREERRDEAIDPSVIGGLQEGPVLHAPGSRRRSAPRHDGFDQSLHAPAYVDEFCGCNFSLDRLAALSLGGFDENFTRAAYRYEAEFAFRWRNSGRRVFYEPRASLRHLKSPSGGTRAFGDHLRTARPDHAMGEYYCLLRTWRGWSSARAFATRPLKAVATRHHLRRPWWIPATLIGEATGAAWAGALALRGPRLASPC